MMLDALRCSNRSSRIPIWMMRQAGRYQPSYAQLRQKYSFDELCLIPELACQVTLLPIQEMDLDAAIIFSDILFPLKALDLDVRFSQSSMPSVHSKDGKADTSEGRAQSAIRATSDEEHLLQECSPVYDAIRLVRKELPSHKPLLGFAGAPWTLLTYILEGKSSPHAMASRVFMSSMTEESKYLLRKVEDLIVHHLNRQIEAGALAVQLFDSWSSELDSESFARWATEPLKRIVSRLKTLPSGERCPVIYFTKGMAYRYSDLLETGIKGLSCDVSLCPSKIAFEAYKKSVAVQGNLDPALLCLPKEHPELKRRLTDLLERASPFSNYIFNLGHGVPKEADYNTVRFVAQTVREWKRA